MRLRRTLQVAVAAAALVSPLAAFALPSVTTAPVVQPAPALALPMLVALAIALIGVGTYCIRTRSARSVAGFALLAGLSVLAALSYAGTGVVVQNADCNMQTMQSFEPGSPLTSLCDNPIRIVAITCSDPPTPKRCFVGEILLNGQSCVLDCVV